MLWNCELMLFAAVSRLQLRNGLVAMARALSPLETARRCCHIPCHRRVML
jgi:hypothetical protein